MPEIARIRPAEDTDERGTLTGLLDPPDIELGSDPMYTHPRGTRTTDVKYLADVSASSPPTAWSANNPSPLGESPA